MCRHKRTHTHTHVHTGAHTHVHTTHTCIQVHRHACAHSFSLSWAQPAQSMGEGNPRCLVHPRCRAVRGYYTEQREKAERQYVEAIEELDGWLRQKEQEASDASGSDVDVWRAVE